MNFYNILIKLLKLKLHVCFIIFKNCNTIIVILVVEELRYDKMIWKIKIQMWDIFWNQINNMTRPNICYVACGIALITFSSANNITFYHITFAQFLKSLHFLHATRLVLFDSTFK